MPFWIVLEQHQLDCAREPSAGLGPRWWVSHKQGRGLGSAGRGSTEPGPAWAEPEPELSLGLAWPHSEGFGCSLQSGLSCLQPEPTFALFSLSVPMDETPGVEQLSLCQKFISSSAAEQSGALTG